MELIRDDGINPAASITGEVWLKLDWNRGCNSCLICVVLEELYCKIVNYKSRVHQENGYKYYAYIIHNCRD